MNVIAPPIDYLIIIRFPPHAARRIACGQENNITNPAHAEPRQPASCGVNCFDGHRFNNYKAQSHTPDMIITDYMTTEWKKRT